METHMEDNENDDGTIAAVKKLRADLESRIAMASSTQLDLLASLRLLVPNIVSDVDHSLQIIASFNNKPFNPIPPLPSPTKKPHDSTTPSKNSSPHRPVENKSAVSGIRSRKHCSGDGTVPSPVSLVRLMVAECLLRRAPFDPIDSSTVLRKLENDQNATAMEKAALREVGGEDGAILAVEMALRSMAEENRGIELEEFVVSGKSRLMVLNIDRNRLMQELPQSAHYPLQAGILKCNDLNNSCRSSEINGNGSEADVTNVGFGVGGVVSQRPMVGDMWMGCGPAGDMWSGSMGREMLAAGGMVMGQRGMVHTMGMGSNIVQLPLPQQQKPRTEEDDIKDVEALLNKKSFLEMKKSKTGEELLDLIHRPTARETAVAAKFKTKGGSQLKEYCSALTKEDCRRQSGSFMACGKVHFRRIIAPHTDFSQGDCSFLDTCRHMKTCKYVHYELDPTPDVPHMMMGTAVLPPRPLKPQRAEYCSEVELGEPQWINCDIRTFKMEILGQFGVIMADPPWDIHMELPYGTMADDEMRTLNVPTLQTDGLIFLWVTGRAMELGRECLELWGYKRVEELIWVKTNQLQRIIRTGRTGHWLNHSKEHCLVGVKGVPEVNRNIDTDVIVAEVRETSRKPDEMYPMLERISPRTRKLELFARMHNTHAGWMSLGNQLDGVRLVDEGLRARFKAAYPDVAVQPPSPPRASSAVDADAAAAQSRSPFVGAVSKPTAAQCPERPTPADMVYPAEEKPTAVETD